MECGISYDTALAHLALPHLKLGLDQYNHLAGRLEQLAGRGQNQRDGNEADVADQQIDGLADLFEFESARINALVHHDTCIRAQWPR